MKSLDHGLLRGFEFVAVVAFLVISSTGCKKRNPTSEVSGSNTVPVQDGYMAVEEIELTLDDSKARCTGFFVAENVMVTAAHCLKNPQYKNLSVSVAGQKPLKTFIHPLYDKEKNRLDQSVLTTNPQYKQWAHDEINLNDLGVLVFDKPMARGLAFLKPDALNESESHAVVGFGLWSNVDDIGKETMARRGKRCGKTKVQVLERQGLILGEGDARFVSNQPGEDASSAPGDSGGPLFDENGFVVGTVQSGVSVGYRDYAVYTSISHPENWSFVQSVVFFHELMNGSWSTAALQDIASLKSVGIAGQMLFEAFRSNSLTPVVRAGATGMGQLIAAVRGGEVLKDMAIETFLVQDAEVQGISAAQNNIGMCDDSIKSAYNPVHIKEMGVSVAPLVSRGVYQSREQRAIKPVSAQGLEVVAVYEESELRLALGQVILGVDGIAFDYPRELDDYVNKKISEDPEARLAVMTK